MKKKNRKVRTYEQRMSDKVRKQTWKTVLIELCMEGLILAQSERWQCVLSMQVERQQAI